MWRPLGQCIEQRIDVKNRLYNVVTINSNPRLSVKLFRQRRTKTNFSFCLATSPMIGSQAAKQKKNICCSVERAIRPSLIVYRIEIQVCATEITRTQHVEKLEETVWKVWKNGRGLTADGTAAAASPGQHPHHPHRTSTTSILHDVSRRLVSSHS